MTQTSTPPTDTTTVVTPKRTPPIGKFFENYALVILTVAVFVFFSAFPASSAAFPTINNLNVILGSQAVVALVAIAALFPLVCGYFDFSLGAVAALAQVL